jgi:hypothetical protein
MLLADVLATQVLNDALPGKVAHSTHMDGYPTDQELAGYIRIYF